MNVTMRIKRVYFDQILSGEKTIEYRDARPFYEKLFKCKDRLKTLTLHYQGERKLVCDVVTVNKIDTPSWLNDPEVKIGRQTFAIVVRNARLV